MTLNIPELKLGFAQFSPKEINNHHGSKDAMQTRVTSQAQKERILTT